VPVGKGKVMKQLRATIERIAAHDAWVLITGEPGSGKEVRRVIFIARVRAGTGRLWI